MLKYMVTAMLLLGTLSSNAQTQSEMNAKAIKDFQTVDKKLNETYQKVLSEYRADKVFITNLRSAQRIWIQFRDAELKAKYPLQSKEYGSVFPVCWNGYKQQLTEERIDMLNVWLEGIEEGDVCSGSVKKK